MAALFTAGLLIIVFIVSVSYRKPVYVYHENPRPNCKYSKFRIPPSYIVMKSAAINLHYGILQSYLLTRNYHVPTFATSVNNTSGKAAYLRVENRRAVQGGKKTAHF
jgi:hypothetical protein